MVFLTYMYHDARFRECEDSRSRLNEKYSMLRVPPDDELVCSKHVEDNLIGVN